MNIPGTRLKLNWDDTQAGKFTDYQILRWLNNDHGQNFFEFSDNRSRVRQLARAGLVTILEDIDDPPKSKTSAVITIKGKRALKALMLIRDMEGRTDDWKNR